MSPTIRSKGGLPLMIGGLVAGADKCCDCGTPQCGCPDLCAYTIEIVTPTRIARRAEFSCDTTQDYTYQYVSDPFIGSCLSEVPGNLCPESALGQFACAEEGQVVVVRGFPGPLFAHVGGRAEKVDPDLSGSYLVRVSFDAETTCVALAPGEYRNVLTLTCIIFMYRAGSDANGYYESRRQFSTFIDEEVCRRAGRQTCNPAYENERFKFIATPLQFALSIADTSLGSYETVYESSPPSPSDDLYPVLQKLFSDNPSATFRITSRPSCKSKTCSCSGDLSGTRWEWLGRVYIHGTYDDQWDDVNGFHWLFDGNETLVFETYDPAGPVDGDGHPIKLLTRQRIDIYCQNTNDGPQWQVLMRSLCVSYDAFGASNGSTEDSWLGRLECFEACADDYRAAGDPLAMGYPQYVEFLGREVTLVECDPPARPTVYVTQIATC